MYGSINGIHAEVRLVSASVRSEIFVREELQEKKLQGCHNDQPPQKDLCTNPPLST